MGLTMVLRVSATPFTLICQLDDAVDVASKISLSVLLYNSSHSSVAVKLDVPSQAISLITTCWLQPMVAGDEVTLQSEVLPNPSRARARK